jgi:hypothetical protein
MAVTRRKLASGRISVMNLSYTQCSVEGLGFVDEPAVCQYRFWQILLAKHSPAIFRIARGKVRGPAPHSQFLGMTTQTMTPQGDRYETSF